MPLKLELLEDRTTPTLFRWTGAGNDNLWENADNWDQNALPTITDDAYFSQESGAIVNQQGAVQVNSIVSRFRLDLIIRGSMTVASNLPMEGELTVEGSLTLLEGATASGPSLDLSGQMYLGAGSQFALSGSSIIHGGQAVIDGPGKLVLWSGDLTVVGSESMSNFDLSGGNLLGPGALAITGTMNWTGGNLASVAGTLNIAASAELNIQAPYYVEIHGWTINNAATINWTQGDVNNTDTALNVNAYGTFNISSSGTWRDAATDGLSSINNAGTINSTATLVTIEAALNSTGNLDVEAGCLSLQAGGSLSGVFDVQANATFVLANGVFLAQAFAQLFNQPQGPLIVDGTTSGSVTLIIAAAQQFGVPSVTLQRLEIRTGATVNLRGGTLVAAGESRWIGGEINGTVDGDGTFRNEGTLTVAGNVRLSAATIENAGTLNWTANFDGAGANVTWSMLGAVVSNDGTWNITTVEGRVMTADGADTITNNAQIVQTGNGQSVFDGRFAAAASFTNNGSIVVQGGTARFFRQTAFSMANNSYLQVDAAAVIRFETGVYTFGSTIRGNLQQMRGQGTFVAEVRAIVVIPQNAYARPNRFELTGDQAFLRGTGEFNPHFMVWTDGRVDQGAGVGGLLSLGSDDVMILDGGSPGQESGDLILGGWTIENRGTIQWQPGAYRITLQNGGTIDNRDFGTFDVYNPAGVMRINLAFGQTGSFLIGTNGVLRKFYTEDNSETATTYFNLPVTNNDGSLVAEGRLRFGSYVQTGEGASYFGSTVYSFDDIFTATDGAITLDGGVMNGGGAPYPFEITGATVSLSGAMRGAVRMRTSNVDLTGNLDVLGASGQREWVRCISSTLNLHGYTLSIPGGGINMASPADSRGILNYQGGRIITPFRDYRNVDVTGPGGNSDGQMMMGPGSTLQVSELGTFGTFSVDGDMDVDPTAQLTFQIGQNQNDQLVVGGQLTLSGTLEVTVLAESLTVGDQFVIATFGSLDGIFNNDTIDIGNGLYLQVLYLDNTIALQVNSYS